MLASIVPSKTLDPPEATGVPTDESQAFAKIVIGALEMVPAVSSALPWPIKTLLGDAPARGCVEISPFALIKIAPCRVPVD